MEMALHAQRDGGVVEVLVASGAAIDAKDLLAEPAERAGRIEDGTGQLTGGPAHATCRGRPVARY